MKILPIASIVLLITVSLAGCQSGVAPTAIFTVPFEPRSSDTPLSITIEASRLTATPTLVAAPQVPPSSPSKTAITPQAALAHASPTITVSETFPSLTVVTSVTFTPTAQHEPPSTATPFDSDTSPYRFHLGWRWKPAESDLLPRFVAANDGSIYVTDTKGVLYRLSSNGDVLWQQQISFAGATPAALSADGFRIYIVGNPNTLFSLNTEAEIQWEYTLQQTTSEPPKVAPWGDIYVTGISSGEVTRISPSGNKLPFELEAIMAEPVSLEGWVFTPEKRILIVESSMLKFYQPDGRLVDSCAIPQVLLAGGPIVDKSGNFYSVSSRGELIAWDGACQERWRFTPETPDVVASSGAAGYPIIIRQDGIIVFMGVDNWVNALNSEGKLIWQTKADETLRFLAAGKRGDVFATTVTGSLRVYNKKGEQSWLEEAPILEISTPMVMTADGGVAFVWKGELWVISLWVVDS